MFALLCVSGSHHHTQIGGIWRNRIGCYCPPKFLAHAHHCDHRKVHPANFFGCIKPPEAKVFGNGIDPRLLILSQVAALARCLARQHVAFQRHELRVHKFADEVFKHPVLFSEFEIQGLIPSQ